MNGVPGLHSVECLIGCDPGVGSETRCILQQTRLGWFADVGSSDDWSEARMMQEIEEAREHAEKA